MKNLPLTQKYKLIMRQCSFNAFNAKELLRSRQLPDLIEHSYKIRFKPYYNKNSNFQLGKKYVS